MPLQNRSLPNGVLVKTTHRGTMMGNRGGRIHDPTSKTLLKRRWVGRRWICCELSFKERQRSVMGDSYTELFFLDEVTALAGGHRPCFECRREDALAFSNLWNELYPFNVGSFADQMDRQLHIERTAKGSDNIALRTEKMVPSVVYSAQGRFFTKRRGAFLEWKLSGYIKANKPDKDLQLHQVTPNSIAGVLEAGYQPRWHNSAH